VIRPWIRYAGFIAGIFVLAWMIHFAVQNAAWTALAINHKHIGTVAASLVLLMMSYACFATAWSVVAERAGLTAPWHRHVQYWLATLPGKYVPGKVWQGVSRIMLYPTSGAAARGGVGLLNEALAQVGCASALAGLSLLGRANGAPWLSWIALAVGLLAITLLSARSVELFATRMLGRFSVTLPSMERGLPWLIIAWQVAGYVVMAAGYILVTFAIGIDVAPIWSPLIGAFLLSGVVGLLAIIAPAGLGVREATFALMMSDFVTTSTAVTLSLLARAWLICGDLAGVAIAMLIAGSAGRQRRA